MNESIDHPFPEGAFDDPNNSSYPVAQYKREIAEVEGAPTDFVGPFPNRSFDSTRTRLNVSSPKGPASGPKLDVGFLQAMPLS